MQVPSLDWEDPIPGLGRSPGGGRAQQPTPGFWPGESHGQRSLAVYSSEGHKEQDTTEATQHARKTMRQKLLFYFTDGSTKAQIGSFFFFFFKTQTLFTYGCPGSLLLCRFFSNGSEWTLECGLSSSGSWAQSPHAMWNLSGPGIEPVSFAMGGRFLTIGPPGKLDGSFYHLPKITQLEFGGIRI